MRSTGIFLWDFINRKVADVDVGGQLWFERSSDFAKLIPNHTAEEWMSLDFIRSIMSTTFLTESVTGIAEETGT